MNKEVISKDMHKFLMISTSMLVLGCIFIYELICTISLIPTQQDNNISIVYNITK